MRMLDEFATQFSTAFQGVEDGYELSVSVDRDIPPRVLSHEIGYDLIDLLVALPNNIHTMSPFVQNLVESSSNIGTVSVDDTQISLVNFARSSVTYHAVQLGTICEIIARRCGFTCKAENHIPGWAVNPDSMLVPMACKAYQQLTGRDMVVEPIHAGVECGAFAQKNPHLDMISIGPTLSGVHTPDECCYLEDVNLTTELLIAVLEKIAEFK